MADDDVDGSHCTLHPYRATSSPGGICALCLQHKLDQLVSSSSSSFIATSSPSPSPSPSPSSFRSLSTTASSTSSSLTLTLRPAPHPHPHHPHADVTTRHPRRGPHLPFLHPKNSSPSLSRSKSSSTPRSARYTGFWSFLYSSSSSGYKKHDRPKVGPGPTTSDSKPSPSQTVTVKNVGDDNVGGGGGDDKTTTGLSSERKVARSRSVGCGSRSFSGDFFERISTGLGDCALRRVESNREGRRSSTSSARDIVVKDRVRCGGLFGGFVITSSSSSSSSSSYLTAVGDDPNGKPNGPATTPGPGPLGHGRSRSWGRALASPMRAFTKPIVTSTTTIKHTSSSGNNNNKGNGTTMKSPNLADIPSLLSVR